MSQHLSVRVVQRSDACVRDIENEAAKRACVCALRLLQAPHIGAGWSSPVARQAHNLKVTGSNPVPASNFFQKISVTNVYPSALVGERLLLYARGKSRAEIREEAGPRAAWTHFSSISADFSHHKKEPSDQLTALSAALPRLREAASQPIRDSAGSRGRSAACVEPIGHCGSRYRGRRQTKGQGQSRCSQEGFEDRHHSLSSHGVCFDERELTKAAAV